MPKLTLNWRQTSDLQASLKQANQNFLALTCLSHSTTVKYPEKCNASLVAVMLQNALLVNRNAKEVSRLRFLVRARPVCLLVIKK